MSEQDIPQDIPHDIPHDIPVVRLREPDQLAEILAEVRTIILKHPVASQAAFSALIEEGKRFAATDAGKEKTRVLANAELTRRLRLVWEGSSGWLLDASRRGLLPSTLLDALFLAAESGDADALLAQLYEQHQDTGDPRGRT